jgi:hypothetical protein
MRGNAIDSGFMYCVTKQANLFISNPAFFPGGGVFRKYLQSTAAIALSGEYGLVIPFCYGKMGTKQ